MAHEEEWWTVADPHLDQVRMHDVRHKQNKAFRACLWACIPSRDNTVPSTPLPSHTKFLCHYIAGCHSD
ncbi:hypothetical protein PAXRUDRAFT_833220 [Paxillus rubicundulus Ve08.2h10]|uniref:Uncharacterized protein n=1 Tax=Paxillus rubicundulus Ve08.2h10 TaxID=930991 RepID=A0A0D0CE41_9AGAM|nr:hypothetical protein PAXRUDRAFT_833220 [Paxillus rubicundulus Ve08.2h10]